MHQTWQTWLVLDTQIVPLKEFNEEYFCSTKKKRSMCIADYLLATSFFLVEILQKWADDQFPFISKGSIYYIKHVQIQLFSIGVEWGEIIVCLMKVSAMPYKCTYCLFTSFGKFKGIYSCRNSITLSRPYSNKMPMMGWYYII